MPVGNTGKNADGKDVKQIAAELEFYRKHQAAQSQKQEPEPNNIMQVLGGFFV